MEKSRILTDTSEMTDTENQRAEKGKIKNLERTLENKTVKRRVITVKRRVITVGSYEEEP
jgi:hypothetical protein